MREVSRRYAGNIKARLHLQPIFDCDILYFLSIECTGAFTFLNEYRIWPCLHFFFLSAQFYIRFFLSRLLYFTLVNLKYSSVCHYLVFADNCFFFFCSKKTKKKDFELQSCSASIMSYTMSVVCL